jgi:hypothetical protein
VQNRELVSGLDRGLPHQLDAQGPEHVVEWHGKKSASALKMSARLHDCKEVRE